MENDFLGPLNETLPQIPAPAPGNILVLCSGCVFSEGCLSVTVLANFMSSCLVI